MLKEHCTCLVSDEVFSLSCLHCLCDHLVVMIGRDIVGHCGGGKKQINVTNLSQVTITMLGKCELPVLEDICRIDDGSLVHLNQVV